MVSPVYLKLLIFLLAISIPACDLSSLVFQMMYSVFKLNKQGDKRQPWHTPSQFQAMFGSNCYFLTCIQVSKEEGQVVWSSYLFQNLPQCVVIYRVKYEFYLFILFIFWNISEKNDENLLNVNSIYLSVLSIFLKEAIATHSSILAWRIPWTEEPGRLQSIGSEETAQAHTEFYR